MSEWHDECHQVYWYDKLYFMVIYFNIEPSSNMKWRVPLLWDKQRCSVLFCHAEQAAPETAWILARAQVYQVDHLRYFIHVSLIFFVEIRLVGAKDLSLFVASMHYLRWSHHHVGWFHSAGLIKSAIPPKDITGMWRLPCHRGWPSSLQRHCWRRMLRNGNWRRGNAVQHRLIKLIGSDRWLQSREESPGWNHQNHQAVRFPLDLWILKWTWIWFSLVLNWNINILHRLYIYMYML